MRRELQRDFVLQLDRSAVLFHLKVPDYASAKRIWKCAVEHHTFFRFVSFISSIAHHFAQAVEDLLRISGGRSFFHS